MGLVVDSSVLIGLERRKLPLSALADLVPSDPLALAAMVAAELLAGVARADTDERRMRRRLFVEAVLDALPVIPFDLAAARAYAELWQQLAQAGLSIGTHDLVIGTTALAHGYGVLTFNRREFDRIPGLTVRDLQTDIGSSS